jgi:hypothetical protein
VRVEIIADPGCGVLRLQDPFGRPNVKWSKVPMRIDDVYTFELNAGEVLIGEVITN